MMGYNQRPGVVRGGVDRIRKRVLPGSGEVCSRLQADRPLNDGTGLERARSVTELVGGVVMKL